MKIKNCPFCDGEDPIAQYDDEGICCVICQYCDAEGPPGWIQWPTNLKKNLILNHQNKKLLKDGI